MLRIDSRSDVQRARAALAGTLTFGRTFADLMVLYRHTPERGWHDGAIVPYGPLTLSPAAKVLHYGLEIFEGHKAYRWPDGEVALFRPEQNAQRFIRSARRLCLPSVPEEIQLEATEVLIDLLREWVPDQRGASLYIRPTLIATEPSVGVRPSNEHLYFIICSPVGPYFTRGFSPISVKIEIEACRAVRGGVGAAKTGGNYAAGLQAQERAVADGFDQVLYLDAVERRYVEELNAMNVAVVMGDELITPELTGTILPGVTRMSLLEIAPDLGLSPVERAISVEELLEGIETGAISEVLAVGTAAVVTPIASLGFRDRIIKVGNGSAGPFAGKIFDAMTSIQYGLRRDPYGWMRVVPRRA